VKRGRERPSELSALANVRRRNRRTTMSVIEGTYDRKKDLQDNGNPEWLRHQKSGKAPMQFKGIPEIIPGGEKIKEDAT